MSLKISSADSLVSEPTTPSKEEEKNSDNTGTIKPEARVDNIKPLDGLRGLAVLLTLGEHLFWAVHDSSHTDANTVAQLEKTRYFWDIGWAGVTLFFVLSGFLLFLPYARAILRVREDYPSTVKFYKRRALRILPAYWASIILIVLFIYPIYLNVGHLDDLGLHFFLLQNLSFETDRTLNPVFWTMAVESQFYILLPLIAYLVFTFIRRGNRRLGGLVFLVLFALSPFYYLLWWFEKNKLPGLLDHITALEVLGYLSVFGVGMLCSLFYIAVTETDRVKVSFHLIRKISKIAGIIGWFLLLIIWISSNIFSPLVQFRYILGGFCFGTILLATLLGWNSWKNFFSNSILRFIGIISYSLYIWNFQFYEHVIVPITEKSNSVPLTIAFGIVLTPITLIPFAYLFYRLFEKPFLKVRRRQH